MRISDWSSDVCSSDLILPVRTIRCSIPGGILFLFIIVSEFDDHVAAFLDLLKQVVPLTLINETFRTLSVHSVILNLYLLIEIQQIGRASCRERVCKYV